VVFVDTENDTFNLDATQIESKITKRTVGIIPVHLYGQPADMDSILSIAAKNKLWVIEDCAQSHLAKFKGKMVGTFGNAATFSFYPGKNLGAYGDAGGLVTNDDTLADWCATYARHGGKGEHIMEGINSRLDGLQAAILNVKLPYLKQWTTARQKVAAYYDELLHGVGDIITPKTASSREHVYHLYVIRTEKRDALKKFLTEREIGTVLNYPKALPFYPAYAYLGHAPKDFPIAYANQSRILSLPIFPEMTEGMLQHVTTSIKQFFTNKKKSS
jgi:dTDP-4-amino-4,6-dideoxygalactose transaminase